MVKLRIATRVLIVLLVLVIAGPNFCVAQNSGLRLVGADWKYKNKTLTDVPIEDLCKEIEAIYGVVVFLEKGIQTNVSLDGKGSELPAALSRVLQPHGLHVHLGHAGVFISREPIPDNVVLLPGNVQLELAIPKGREQQQYDDFSSKWEQGDSRIVVRAEKSDKSLKQIGEERVKPRAEIYKITQQYRKLISKKDKEYLTVHLATKPTKELLRKMKEQLRYFGEKSHEIEENMSRQFTKMEPEKRKEVIAEILESSKRRFRLGASEMVSDEIVFKNDGYVYTVSHAYPKSANKAGAAVTKRLWESINWTKTSKFKPVR